MGVIEISIESSVKASPEEAWAWITSLQGISEEMRPYFRMTAPAGVTSINDIAVEPGKPLFRSRVFLFCILPIDYSDITLVEINKGSGFIEQSPRKERGQPLTLDIQRYRLGETLNKELTDGEAAEIRIQRSPLSCSCTGE